MHIGEPFIQLTEVASTNAFLQAWAAEENLPEGAAVNALYQTAGRGQRGTNWHSAPGENILTSVLLYPHFILPDEQFWLSKAMSLAVKIFVQKQLPDVEVHIKWPNDIYINAKKVAGILIENTLQGSRLRSSIVGIGINLNQTEQLLAGAVSFKKITGQYYPINHLLPQLYNLMEYYYLQLKNSNLQDIEAFYTNSLYGLHKKLLFRNNTEQHIFEGIIRGTSLAGALLIETESGISSFDIKEISLL